VPLPVAGVADLKDAKVVFFRVSNVPVVELEGAVSRPAERTVSSPAQISALLSSLNSLLCQPSVRISLKEVMLRLGSCGTPAAFLPAHFLRPSLKLFPRLRDTDTL